MFTRRAGGQRRVTNLSVQNVVRTGDNMAGLIPKDDIKRLQRRMNRLVEDTGLSDIESRYMPDIRRFQGKMNRLVEDMVTEPPLAPMDVAAPLADVKETDKEVIVTMDLPGVEKGDINIFVSEDSLEVKAEQKKVTEEKEEDFYRKERTYSRLERVLKLPAEVKSDEAKASLKDGVLEVYLPKVEVTIKKKVTIT